jgi:hypothetical protein
LFLMKSACWVMVVLNDSERQIISNQLSKQLQSQASVAHAYDPKYSRGRDQEDLGSRPTHQKKRLPEWFKWYSACLASMRHWAQTPVLRKNKNSGNSFREPIICCQGKSTLSLLWAIDQIDNHCHFKKKTREQIYWVPTIRQ